MKKNMRAVIVCLLWASASSVSAQSQSPNETAANSQTDTKPAAVRTLDDIRLELKKKQAEANATPDEQGESYPGGMMGGMDGGMGMGMSMEMGGMMGGPPTEKQLIGMLIAQLRGRLESKDHKRETTEKKLRAALEQYFLLDMEERVRELDRVKARVAAMEAKLQRRLESESDILDLQIKQIIHKADGLDFTIPNTPLGMGMGGMGGMGMGMGGMPGGMGGGEMPGMSMGGMGGPGMGGLPSGGMESMDLSQSGYDVSFGLTRLQRTALNDLDADDPLQGYADIVPKALGNDADTPRQKMTTILAALHYFHERFKHFPKAASQTLKNQPPHSWRVAILPLIGEGELYKQYRFDQPWDSEQNKLVAAQMPELYRATQAQKDKTSFLMVVGAGAFASTGAPTRMADVKDGLSNTISMVLSDREVPWTKPDDVNYSTTGPLPGLDRSRIVGMADGSARVLTELSPTDFRAMISRAAGETVNTRALAK